MILKCCILGSNISTDKCVQVLSWMEDKNIPFSTHVSFTTKLIAKCGTNINELNQIVELIQKEVIYNTVYKNDIIIKTALINAYGICSDIQSAQNIFVNIDNEQMNVVCIGAMMNALIHNDLNAEAIELYEKYQTTLSNYVTQLSVLKACVNIKDFDKGKKIIEQQGFLNTDNNQLKSSLINFYGSCGDIDTALSVFDTIQDDEKDIVNVNCIITAHINNNQNAQALILFDKIYSFNKRINPDNITYMLALKACAAIKDVEKGYEILESIEDNQVIDNIAFKNTLINFYGTCSQIKDAIDVFESIHDVKEQRVSIGAMMTAFIDNNCYEQALELYDECCSSVVDNVSHMMAIKACIGSDNLDQGQGIIAGLKHIEQNSQLVSTLIDFYGHFGDINNARQVYDGIADEKKSFVNICAMMNVYIENNQDQMALDLYDDIDESDMSKDETCHMLAIKACINLGNFDKGKSIHSEIASECNDTQLLTTLINLYGDALEIDKAIEIFDTIDNDKKNVVTMGAMMDAYCKSNLNEECIELFKSLSSLNIEPDVICYALLFTACTNGTSYYYGTQIHEKLKNCKDLQYILRYPEVQTNLINMYGKCGMMDKCEEIFQDIDKNKKMNKNKRYKYDKHDNNMALWNAMIHSYGRNGFVDKSIELCHKMEYKNRLKPDSNTYAIILNACSHCGDDKLARHVWLNEINDEKVQYDIFVMTALIDCIARKGFIIEAFEWMMKYKKKTKDILSDEVMYTALMAGCKKHDNLLMAQFVYNEMERKFKNNSKYMSSASAMLRSMYINKEQN